MYFINKVLNKLNTHYLNICYKTIKLKQNVTIDYRCEIEEKNNIFIGENSILYKYITIYKARKGQFILGDFSHIAPYGYFLIANQRIMIGDNVAIAKNCAFFCSTNSIPKDKTILFKDSYEVGNIILGNNVFIGANCVILPNTRIEDNVVVASNSAVKGELKANFLYGGNPVKQIRRLYDV